MITGHKKTIIVFILSIIILSLLAGCSLKKLNNRRAMLLYYDGIQLASKGELDQALEKFNKSIAVSQKNKFTIGIAHNYNEIGNIYTYKKKFSIARDYFNQALIIYKENNMATEVSKSFDNMAKTYLRQGDFNNTLNQYEKLAAWDIKTDNMLGAGLTKYNMALLCEKYIKDYDKAKNFYGEALEIFIKLNKEKEAMEAKKGIKRMTF